MSDHARGGRCGRCDGGTYLTCLSEQLGGRVFREPWPPDILGTLTAERRRFVMRLNEGIIAAPLQALVVNRLIERWLREGDGWYGVGSGDFDARGSLSLPMVAATPR